MVRLDARNRGAAVRRAERQAAEILQHFEIKRPPTPENIVLYLGNVVVEYMDWKEIAGACSRVNGKWVIAVNRNDVKARQRFTIMHEFKHALDGVPAVEHYPKNPNVRKSFYEYLADQFAVHILMPEEWMRTYYPRLKRLDRMAWLFKVSMPAMKARLEELGLRPRSNDAKKD